MRIVPKQPPQALAGDIPVAFRQLRGAVLECTEGRLWVTIAGQPGDFFLVPGERLRVRSNGLVLVAGFPAGVLRLTPPQAPHVLRARIGRALAAPG